MANNHKFLDKHNFAGVKKKIAGNNVLYGGFRKTFFRRYVLMPS